MNAQDTLVGFVSGGEDPSLSPLVSRIGDRYEILGLLGQGGMGTVYRVRDLHLDEEVALKQLRPGLLTVAGMLGRFRQEVKLARRITHPNVIRIFDLGEADGQHFLTMELVVGQSLARRLREGRLPTGDAIRIVQAISAGVGAAHGQGVVHCDLKPDNVLLAGDRVAVADFGLARAVGTGGQIAGTPTYMAPEQVRGGNLGPLTDQYALGAILYEALVGRPMWGGDDPREVALARLRAPPPDPRTFLPTIDAGLAAVLVRSAATDPADRFPDLEAFDRALVAFGRPHEALSPVSVASVPLRDAVSVVVLVPRAPADDLELATTLAEDLVDLLGATRGLRVRPISGLPMQLPADPQAVGQQLGATVVVEGSLRRKEGGVRWSLRAVGAADGYQVWSGRYEASTGAILAMVDQAARALAGALAAPLAGKAPVVAQDSAVVEAYFQMRALARTIWGHDAGEAWRIAEAAIAVAPDDPLLLACKALVCANLAFRAPTDPEQWIAEGRAAANRAIQRAPLLADAWLGLARIEWVVADLPAAARALHQALALNAGLTRAQEMLGAILLEIGDLEEGILRLEAVMAADPLSVLARTDLVRAFVYQGRWDKADLLLAAPLASPSDESNRLFQVARFALWRAPSDPVGPPLPAADAPVQAAGQAELFAFVRAWRSETKHDFSALGASMKWATTLRNKRFRSAVLQVMAECAMAVDQPAEALQAVRDGVDGGLLDIQWMDHAPMLAPMRSREEWPALRAPVAARAAAVRLAIAGG